MAQNITAPVQQLFNSSGSPLSGAKLFVYQTGTTTELSLYSDEALSTAIANPIIADAAGVFAQAFLSESEYKVLITDADDVSLYSRDPVYSVSNASSLAATAITFDGSGIGFSSTNVQDAIEESIDVITENPTFKDSADNTKSITFDLSGITTATDRDIAWPDASGTVLLSVDIGDTVQGYDADTLKADTADVLSAAYEESNSADGTKSSGTYTPSLASGTATKTITNGGAFTLAPPSPSASDTTLYMSVFVTNNGSAGAITTSGFDIVTGDDFDTTDTNMFWCRIQVIDIGGTEYSHLDVVAMQ